MHNTKTYGGVNVYAHAFLTSVLDGGEWSASLSSHFTALTPLHGKELPVPIE
jgi:hypothetical protein